VEATLALRSTILRGLTMGRMLMLSGLTVPEQRRAGAATPLRGTATKVVAASLCRGVFGLVASGSTATQLRKPPRGCRRGYSTGDNVGKGQIDLAVK
jgi:hypothetical protein